MDLLLHSSNVNYEELKRLMTRTTAEELSNLSEPCYYPSLNKNKYEFLRYTGLTEDEIKEFVNRYYKDQGAAAGMVVRDAYTNLTVFMMHYFLDKKDRVGFMSTMIFHNIRMYTNFQSSNIKYCNPVYFKYALEHLGKNHLFSVHKTIGSAIYYLSMELVRKHEEGIKGGKVTDIMKFITECRSRIAQSCRSFNELYYYASEHGLGMTNPYETEEGVQINDSGRTAKIVEDAVKKITIYGIIDNKALNESKQLTKISKSDAEILVKKLSNVKYTDHVKLVLELYVRSLTDAKDVCGKGFYQSVQKLMATKRSTSEMYFKKQIEILLDELLIDGKITKKFSKYTNQTQYLSKLFLAFYITMVMRNSIC